MDSSPAVRHLWARTKLRVHDARYRLVSLPPSELGRAAEVVGSLAPGFAALIIEPSEVSMSIPEAVWEEQRARFPATREDGPFRAISFDLDVDLSTWGYFAPAAVRLAEAGVSIVPQCAFLKDHLLVRSADLLRAVAVLEALIHQSRIGG